MSEEPTNRSPLCPSARKAQAVVATHGRRAHGPIARGLLACGLLACGLLACEPHAPGEREASQKTQPALEVRPPKPLVESALAPIQLGPGLVVDRAHREVIVDAHIAVSEGWLEQAVCKAGTRDHESLLVVAVQPSRLHAALLLAGFEPGHPGSWRLIGAGDGATIERVPPAGARLELWVRVAGADVPLTAWMHDPVQHRTIATHPWVFAGSVVRPNTRSMGPGEHYVADYTGSVVGIVTFGDEPIALDRVYADQVEVDEPVWQARTDAMPESGTPVQLVIRPGAM